jgi:Entner-Doudoroff aldolase
VSEPTARCLNISASHRKGSATLLDLRRPLEPAGRPRAPLSASLYRAHTCRAGGITIMEVTFRTAAAEAALLALKDAAIPGMCIGAGTVLTVEQAEAAIAAGSEFVISPGVNPEVVAYCVAHDVPVFPGIATPTDIQAAMNLGVDTLKFFPAEANGGIPTLSALAAVFSMIKFMPTGGITSDNIAEYLAVRDTRERLTHFTQIGLLLHSLCLPPIIALTCQ